MATVADLGPTLGVQPLCAAFGVSTATYYRQRGPVPPGPRPRRTSARALGPAEQQQVLDLLHEPRFVDLAPAQVYATLLDDGIYHCAERTMYRILAAHDEVRERRAQRRHPVYTAPERLATGVAKCTDPDWNADGHLIAFTAWSGSSKSVMLCL